MTQNIIFIIITALHGLIHLLGFMRAFDLAKLGHFSVWIPRSLGICWLVVASLFILAAVLFATSKQVWIFIAMLAVVLSQIVIVFAWSDAKFGTIANLIIFIVTFVGLGSYLLKNKFTEYVQLDLLNNNTLTIDTLNTADIEHLPAIVQKYLHYTQSVGQPKIQNFRAEFIGGMRTKPDQKYMKVHSVQYNFYQNPARYFYMNARRFGLPASGLHQYQHENATFQIWLLNWLLIVDAKGEKMTQSETVTLFNDMCLIAPAALIDRRIVWQEIDPLTINATYTNGTTSIQATLHFNARGELINFISTDRYHTNGKTYENYPWETPVEGYRAIRGYFLPSKAKLIYKRPAGDFVYGELEYQDVQYNVSNVY